MGHSVTLGGDRLGSGKKQRIHLHGYERSTHDLGKMFRTTMSAGTLVPCYVCVGLPGDTHDINIGCDVRTHPTVGPLFGSYKVQIDVFTLPFRLYQGVLHNNKIGIGMKMADIKLPQVILKGGPLNPDATDFDNQQVNPSCIWNYLGIRGINATTSGDGKREFNAIPWLGYWDTVKNYYTNKQEEIGAVIHYDLSALVETITGITVDVPSATIDQAPTIDSIHVPVGSTITVAYTGTQPIPAQIIFNTTSGPYSLEQLGTVVFGTGTLKVTLPLSTGPLTFINWDYISADTLPVVPPTVATFPLENLDTMREELLKQMDTSPVVLNTDIPGYSTLYPYPWATEWVDNFNPMLSTQEGLAVKTYQSDIFNNWLNTEWIDGPGGINEITAIDTTGGSFDINTLLISKKVYDMLNRIAVSGGTYNDWIEANWDQEPFTRPETPVYHGGLSKELIFQEVVSNSASQDGQAAQPLGTLAGKGAMAHKHKGGTVHIKLSEPSYIMIIASITPRIDYSQGNQWDTQLKTMDDLHKPALDEIGYQELITENMAWWTTQNASGVITQKSAGKQPAWINYMTNYNTIHGNFAIRDNEMYMTLNRRYEYDGTGDIKDLTTYIDPTKFNFIFAQTSLDAQNFWVQVAIDNTARRKMSAKVMPNL